MTEFKIMDHLRHCCLNKEECPVCLNDTFTKTVALLHSKDWEQDVHRLCKNCFEMMLATNLNPLCPLCRNKDYIPIILDHELGLLQLPIQKGVQGMPVVDEGSSLMGRTERKEKRKPRNSCIIF